MADCKSPEAKQIMSRQRRDMAIYIASSNCALPVHTSVSSVPNTVEAMCRMHFQGNLYTYRV